MFSRLTAFLFLNKYCRYYILTNQSKITYYGDNLEVIVKLKNIQSNPYYYDKYIRTIDYDAVQLLKFYIPSSITIHHVIRLKDKRKNSRIIKHKNEHNYRSQSTKTYHTICSYYGQNVDDLKVHSVLILFLST